MSNICWDLTFVPPTTPLPWSGEGVFAEPEGTVKNNFFPSSSKFSQPFFFGSAVITSRDFWESRSMFSEVLAACFGGHRSEESSQLFEGSL